MNLLMLTNDWPPIEGGISSLCVGTATALARRGHRVLVRAPAPGPAGTIGGVTVRRWRGYGLGKLRWLPFAIQSAEDLSQFDAVLAMNPGYGGLLACIASPVPYYCWGYGYELLKGAAPVRRLYGHIYQKASRPIAISRFTADLITRLGVDPSRIAVIPPGVDLQFGNGSTVPANTVPANTVPANTVPANTVPANTVPANTVPACTGPRERFDLGSGPIVLTVARIVRRKGHPELLAAIRGLVGQFPDLRWVVVGRGPELESLRSQVADLGLERVVRLLGYVSPTELHDLYSIATTFALAPASGDRDAEGFGIVYLEAGAHGTPVVASHSGGVPEAVRDGVSGLLVPAGDVDVLRTTLARVLGDPGLRAKLGAGGREIAAEHSWDRIGERLEDVLTDSGSAASR